MSSLTFSIRFLWEEIYINVDLINSFYRHSEMETGQPSHKRRFSDLGSERREDSTLLSTDKPPATRRRIEEERPRETEQSVVLDPMNAHPLTTNGTEAVLLSTGGEHESIPEADSPLGEDKTHGPTLFVPLPDPRTVKPKPIPFQQPSPLTSFSYTPDHVQEFTDSALRYYVDPPLGSNLSYGYERWIRKPDTRGRIDSLLKAVSRVKNDARQNGGLPEIGLVSWRGVMSKYALQFT